MQTPNLPPLPENLRPDPDIVALQEGVEQSRHRQLDAMTRRTAQDLEQTLALANQRQGTERQQAYDEAARLAIRVRDPEAARIVLATQDALAGLRTEIGRA